MSQGVHDNDGGDEKSILVFIVIPSHAEDETLLPDKVKDKWIREAQTIFAKLFTGSTAFDARAGSYWSETKSKILWDKPVIVESWARVEIATDLQTLASIHKLALGIKAKMNQECVMVGIDSVIHFI